MSDNTEDNSAEPKRSKTETVIHVVERGSSAADAAGNAFNAVKWVAIAVVSLVFLVLGWTAYKIVSKPAAMVGGAVEGVTGAVKSGTDKVKSGTTDLKNRLVISVSHQDMLNKAAEAAFTSVTDMAASEPAGIKDKLFRASNFSGSGNKVCALSVDLGAGKIPVFIAADNEAYATAKALGSKGERLMRVVIQTGADDVELNTEWDTEVQSWILKWKTTTVKKPVGDDVAEARMLDVLRAAKTGC